jgi:hypothetical protein
MRSLIHSLPTFPATLATPQSAAVIAGCDRLRPILDIWIAAIVKRVGAFESLLGLIGRYVIA